MIHCIDSPFLSVFFNFILTTPSGYSTRDILAFIILHCYFIVSSSETPMKCKMRFAEIMFSRFHTVVHHPTLVQVMMAEDGPIAEEFTI